ncbi:MAG: class I SAM-dependent methyltransferase [Chitinispirillaceae bacterium]
MSLFNLLYSIGLKFKKSSQHLIYGRQIIVDWTEQMICSSTDQKSAVNILDVGCGKAEELSYIKGKHGSRVNLYALENYEPYRIECVKKGITPSDINIENDPFPFKDGFFDVIIMNQVIEHCKELFFIFSEVSRTLRKGGCLIVGVPNLAAWHDRFALLLGEQPTSIKVLGPHIRGFTKPGFQSFIQTDGYFLLKETKGSGFYPFPVFAAKLLARLFPTLASGIFFRAERTGKEGLFIDVLKSRYFETNFFSGS